MQFSIKNLSKALMVVLCATLVSCANLDRRIKDVTVKSKATEQIESIAFVFISPEWLDKDPSLVQGYRLSGALDKSIMTRSGDRIADFFNINNVKSEYIGSYGIGYNIKWLLSDLGSRGYYKFLFFPVGSSITSKNGAPVYGQTRYKVVLYNKKSIPVLEFYDEFSARSITSNPIDSSAAGWLNVLIDHGFVRKNSEKLISPVYRDFHKEDLADELLAKESKK